MPSSKYAAYEAARPYFELVRGALRDLVEGDHFFDIVARDLVYEVLYDFAGWPRIEYPRDGCDVRQSALFNHKDREPEDRALERLHGLSRSLERIDGACSLEEASPRGKESAIVVRKL